MFPKDPLYLDYLKFLKGLRFPVVLKFPMDLDCRLYLEGHLFPKALLFLEHRMFPKVRLFLEHPKFLMAQQGLELLWLRWSHLGRLFPVVLKFLMDLDCQ
jgi:hypothetical protein